LKNEPNDVDALLFFLTERSSAVGRKEAYEERLDADLWEWENRIEELKAKADRCLDGSRPKYQKQIERLRSKHREVEKSLEELRLAAGEEALDELKPDIESAWKKLKQAVDSAGSKIQ
jgi:hypothetical protein